MRKSNKNSLNTINFDKKNEVNLILLMSPKKALRSLLTIILILLIGNLFTIYLLPIFDYNYNKSVIRFLNFNSEQNFPTLFSFIILSISSFLLFYIAKSSKNQNKEFKIWLFLGYTFIFLSLDEILSIHEVISSIFHKLFFFDGVFYFAWVIPYGILIIIFSILLFKFLLKLPKETSKLFLISGAIFVVGAIGFEMIGGKVASTSGMENLIYIVLTSIEETLEMFGISLFIYALLRFITISSFKPIIINFQK